MRNIARLLFSWVRRLTGWLARGRLAAFAFAVVVVGVWIALAMRTEPAVRLSGLIFQLLGVIAAAIGIRDTRRMFGKPSFLQVLRNWAASLPHFKPKAQSVSVSGAISIGASASATVWHGTAPGATLDQRFAAMEANLKDVESRVRVAENQISNSERAFNSKLREESEERKRQDRDLRMLIEAASTDGLYLAATGAFWIAVGLILSTASNEILCLIGGA
jgi:hypothetical protein